MVRRRWRWAVVLGVVVAAALSFVVLRTEPATAGPTGLALSAAVLWRGVAYGAADGLMLSAFPILAVFAASEGSKLRRRRFGTVAVGAAAMVASLLMTTVYHLGYRDFRSALLARPVAGPRVERADPGHPQPDRRTDCACGPARDGRVALVRDRRLLATASLTAGP